MIGYLFTLLGMAAQIEQPSTPIHSEKPSLFVYIFVFAMGLVFVGSAIFTPENELVFVSLHPVITLGIRLLWLLLGGFCAIEVGKDFRKWLISKIKS